MTAVTARSLPRSIQMNRTLAVTDEVLNWARAHQLNAGFSRVPLSTYEAYLKAHPHLPEGAEVISTYRAPVRVIDPQPGQIAQMLRSAERRTAKLAETSLGKAVSAWQESVRVEAGMPMAPAVKTPKPKAKSARKPNPDKSHGRKYPVGIREWARGAGYRVGNGAVAPEVVEAFYAAHPDQERLAHS